MTTNALAQLAALAQAARVDGASAEDVLAQVLAILQEPSLAATRELAVALLQVAQVLAPAGSPAATEGLFAAAQRVLDAASDARVDEQLVLWHNLSLVYDRHGAADHGNALAAAIGACAETYTGPLHAQAAGVFLERGLAYRRLGSLAPMLTMLRQVHRYRNAADQDAAGRLNWLESYALLLLEAGRWDEAATLVAEGMALARAANEDERELNLLSLAGHAWFQAGEFEAASDYYLQAVRRRLAAAGD